MIANEMMHRNGKIGTVLACLTAWLCVAASTAAQPAPPQHPLKATLGAGDLPGVVSSGGPSCVAVPDDSYDGTVASMSCLSFPGPVGTITDVDVNVAINHSWAGDLTLKAVSPSGTVSTLMSRPGFSEPADDGTLCCGDSSNLAETSPLTFADGLGVSAETMGSTILGGSVICQDDGICGYFPFPDTGPGTSLADFNGEPGAGTWRLCMGDGAGGDVGDICMIGSGFTFSAGSPPVFTKAFAPETIVAGGISTVTFTIDNTANGTAATALSFTDMLPAGVVIAETPNASQTCTGGASTATADSDTFSFSGGNVGASASCTISVDVTSSSVGAHLNTSGDLTSSAGNSGTAAGTLTVTEATFSFPTATGSGTVTGGGSTCAIGDAYATTPSAIAGAGPPDVGFPHGLVAFRLEGCGAGAAVTIKLTFPAALPPGTEYWKYGRTPTDPTPHWYPLETVIAGNEITFTIRDGGLGDDDLTANGVIGDPGGPGLGLAVVPTMPMWALGMLTLFLIAAVRVALRLRPAPHV